jgi:hypothetical protein
LRVKPLGTYKPLWAVHPLWFVSSDSLSPDVLLELRKLQWTARSSAHVRRLGR